MSERTAADLRREPILLLAIAALAIVAFLSLAMAMRSGMLAPLDTAVLRAAHATDTPALDRIMHALSDLGWAPLVALLVVSVASWSWLRGDAVAALTLVAISVVEVAADGLLKNGFQRPRPELWPRMQVASFAFPSGHAMTTVAIYGMAAVVLARRLPAARWPAWIVAPLIVVAVGASRIFLGVHWPSDVLAGWSAGAVLLVAGYLTLLRWPAE